MDEMTRSFLAATMIRVPFTWNNRCNSYCIRVDLDLDLVDLARSTSIKIPAIPS